MAIGKHPREWIIEILGSVLSIWGFVRGLLQGDLFLLSVSFAFFATVAVHYRMRVTHNISVRSESAD